MSTWEAIKLIALIGLIAIMFAFMIYIVRDIYVCHRDNIRPS